MTPFVARMQELARDAQGSTQSVDVFYCTRQGDPDITQGLRELAASAGVQLHVVEAATQGHLSAQRWMDSVPQWREASVWFCGPAAVGEALREGLTSEGLAAGDFHREDFNVR